MIREGFDYSTGPIPPSVVKNAGRDFVIRYVTSAKWSKLTRPEYLQIVGSGLDLALVWELTATRSREVGFDGGAADMSDAMNYARSLGIPADAPIYIVADDWGAAGTELPKIKSYVDGAVSVRGWRLTGAYGGYAAIQYLSDRNTCRYYWQTAAWSSKQWHPRANLQQYNGDVQLGNFSVDHTRAMTVDFGQLNYRREPCSDPLIELFGEVEC